MSKSGFAAFLIKEFKEVLAEDWAGFLKVRNQP